MIQEAGAERRRIDGLPGERVGSRPAEPVPGRGGQGRGDLPGRASRQTSATRTSTVG